MTVREWPAIPAVLALLGMLLGAAWTYQRRFAPSPEGARKLFHVGAGLIALTLPLFVHSPAPILVLCGLALAVMLALKHVPAARRGPGQVLFRVERDSYGEICFPLGIGLLLLLSAGHPLLYVIPILVLTLADTVAALIGAPYGRMRYVAGEGHKSVEGSLAFALVAFLSVHIPLLLFSHTGRAQSLLIASVVGLLVMMAEAIAWRGLDNLFIPLATYFLLGAFLHLGTAALAGQLLIVAGLAAIALVWRKRTTLNDGALMGCILGGYVILVLGGPFWLLVPLLLFLGYMPLTEPGPTANARGIEWEQEGRAARISGRGGPGEAQWPAARCALHGTEAAGHCSAARPYREVPEAHGRTAATKGHRERNLDDGLRPHNVHVVLSLASAGLVWLALARTLHLPSLFYPFTIVFAAHLAIIGIARAREAGPDTSGPALLAPSIVKAWLLLLCVYASTAESPSAAAVRAVLGLAGIAAAALAFYATQPGLRLGPPASVRWNREALCAAAGSLAGLLPLFPIPHG